MTTQYCTSIDSESVDGQFVVSQNATLMLGTGKRSSTVPAWPFVSSLNLIPYQPADFDIDNFRNSRTILITRISVRLNIEALFGVNTQPYQQYRNGQVSLFVDLLCDTALNTGGLYFNYGSLAPYMIYDNGEENGLLYPDVKLDSDYFRGRSYNDTVNQRPRFSVLGRWSKSFQRPSPPVVTSSGSYSAVKNPLYDPENPAAQPRFIPGAFPTIAGGDTIDIETYTGPDNCSGDYPWTPRYDEPAIHGTTVPVSGGTVVTVDGGGGTIDNVTGGTVSTTAPGGGSVSTSFSTSPQTGRSTGLVLSNLVPFPLAAATVPPAAVLTGTVGPGAMVQVPPSFSVIEMFSETSGTIDPINVQTTTPISGGGGTIDPVLVQTDPDYPLTGGFGEVQPIYHVPSNICDFADPREAFDFGGRILPGSSLAPNKYTTVGEVCEFNVSCNILITFLNDEFPPNMNQIIGNNIFLVIGAGGSQRPFLAETAINDKFIVNGYTRVEYANF